MCSSDLVGATVVGRQALLGGPGPNPVPRTLLGPEHRAFFSEGQRHLNQLAFAAIQHGHPLSGDHLYALLSALSEKNQAL